jgi:hypothetical protein
MSDQYPTQPGPPGWGQPGQLQPVPPAGQGPPSAWPSGQMDRPHGSFTAVVGGYGGVGLTLHIVATVLTLGMWVPVLATYLIGWRKRTVTLHVSDGVVVRVESS